MPHAGQEPHVTVVVPTYRRREVAVGCVRALAAQVEAPPFEVVVVDDGGGDGTAAALRALETPFPLRVLEQANAGPASARNSGAAAARGEVLLFLDDDMEADPRLLAEHERFRALGFDVVLGDIPLHPDSAPGFLSEAVGAWAAERARKLAAGGGRVPLEDLITGQMSLGREAFEAVGGFDTGFDQRLLSPNADLDFGHRLAAAGLRIGFNPAAVSRQRYVVTPGEYLDRWREIGRANVLFARKHPDQLEAIFRRRERPADRLVWRRLRRPLRALVLALAGRSAGGRRLTRWFYRVRNLEYFEGVREAGGVPGRHAVRVLCYHAVDAVAGGVYGVAPDELRRQLAWLRSRYHFVSARELLGFLRDENGVPRRAVLVTFDDCYADLLEAALPTLREHDAPALAFAVTQRLGASSDWSRSPNAESIALLGADGLRELRRDGVEIGSHTRTHAALTRLAPPELEDELRGSADDIAALGLPRPAFLAYPFGDHDAATRAAAAAAGYEAAFTTQPGFVRSGADPLALPRIEIHRGDTGRRFRRLVLTGRRPR
jgi:peptidoglycan/xylan/chitin deacetylase (PgdA/CDA1 family)/GT2 family glycosyltransferase